MSVYLTAGDDQYQAASNRGWSDLGEWADRLDAGEYPLVVQLWEHGVAEPAAALLAQFEAAVKATPPEADGLPDTLAGIVRWLGSVPPADPVIVSDGTQPGEGGAGEEPATFR